MPAHAVKNISPCFSIGKAAFNPAGARLFVFSDGAYEIQQHDGSMMSHDDLRGLLARAPQGNAPAWIMEQLRAINSQPVFDDDVSLVELCFP